MGMEESLHLSLTTDLIYQNSGLKPILLMTGLSMLLTDLNQ